jgi:hypothetical protein
LSPELADPEAVRIAWPWAGAVSAAAIGRLGGLWAVGRRGLGGGHRSTLNAVGRDRCRMSYGVFSAQTMIKMLKTP